jgi:hypothetical protein
MPDKPCCGNCRWLDTRRDDSLDDMPPLDRDVYEDMAGPGFMEQWHSDSAVCTNRKSENYGLALLEGSNCKLWEKPRHLRVVRPRKNDSDIPF